jgi:hypothetical protein
MNVELLTSNILSLNNLDEIFYSKLPKDLVNYIYEFIQPICDGCLNCCDICKINCFFTEYCNRNNVCCVGELERLIHCYENQNEEKKKKEL